MGTKQYLTIMQIRSKKLHILIRKLSSNVAILILSIFLCVIPHESSAERQLSLYQISKEKGLAASETLDVVEDDYGFMWIATMNGLQRYDGNDFVLYTINSRNNHQISHNTVFCLGKDVAGNIWIGTDAGLDLYSKKKAQISNIKFSLSKDDIGQAKRVRSIYRGQDNDIWVGSYYGLIKINTITLEKEYYPFKIVRSIASLDNNNLIIGTLYSGLYEFNILTKTFTKITSEEHSFDNIPIVDLFKNKDEIIISSWGEGIFSFDSQNKKLSKKHHAITSKYIRSYKVDRFGKKWVGTNDGIFTIDELENVEHYKLLSSKMNEKYGKEIRKLRVSKSGDIWIATYGGGVFVHPSNADTFSNHAIATERYNNPVDNIVYSVMETSDKVIYYGTQSGNLNKLNKETGEIEPISLYLNGSPFNTQIDLIAEIDSETLLIGSLHESFFVNIKKQKQELKNQRIINYRLPAGVHTNNRIIGIENGVYLNQYRYTKETGLEKINHLLTLPVSSIPSIFNSHNLTYVLYEDGTIYEIDFSNNIPLISKLKESEDIDARGIVKDKAGNIWIGSLDRGIIRYEKKNSTLVKRETIESRKSFYGTVYDHNSNSIVSATVDGLFIYNIDKKTQFYYSKFDGLPSNQITNNNTTTIDGEVIVGTIDGLSIFNPSELHVPRKNPQVMITDFLLDNTIVPPQDTSESILKTSILETNALKLDYSDNFFGFKFSSIALVGNDNIAYQYRLVNFQNQWSQTNSENRIANYTNVPPGDYIFQVRAKSRNFNWENNIKSIQIKISPPWWQTLPAYALYIFVIFLLTYSIVAIRTKTIRERSTELENQVKDRTNKIEQLLAQKNEELTNISHELRTPLTLILGPIKQLIEHDPKNSRLNIVQRNSYRLLRMVDQLLNLETFRVKSITQKSPQAFRDIILNITEAFKPVATQKEIALDIGKIEAAYFDFTPDALEKIFLNILSNAIKYTNRGGQIYVETFRDKTNNYIITVKDTGIGIESKDHAKIFERFSRIHNNNSEQVSGAGIGLALVKSLVESHNGSITLESEVSVGTTIRVTLPIINEVSSGDLKQLDLDQVIASEFIELDQNRDNYSLPPDKLVNGNEDKKATVLIIEDNLDMQAYIADSISAHYRVIVASNGAEGLQIATTEVPDLVVSDIMMPGLDGYQVTRRLRSSLITNHIPIVLLTARGDRESRLRGWHEQADEYLTKPFDDKELLIRLQNLLSIRNILKKRFSEIAFEQPSALLTASEEDIENSKNEALQAFIDKLNSVLDKVYMDADITVAHITKTLAISERQFHRKMKSVLDMTPIEYLRRYRLEKAKLLLAEGKTANVASFEVGFASHSYFGRCFKAQFGVSPSQFKKSLTD